MDLNQVTIRSADVDRSVRFYQRLGLKLIVNSAPRYVRFLCPNGNTSFSIHHSAETVSPGEAALYFECQDLDAQVAKLKNEDVVFDLEPTDQDWLWRESHLRDPDGHKLILYFAGENRLNPPWRIQE